MTVDNLNAAIDFERFERREAVRPELAVVRTNRAERVAADRQRLALLRTVALLLVVAVIAAFYLISKVQITELTQQITDANKVLAEMKNESVRLSLMMDSQLSMSNIETYAEEMGLAKVQQYQVKCIPLNSEDVITIHAVDKGFFSEVWEGITGFFAGVGAYIGL